MKILMLTPLSPYPPHGGVQIRLWEQVKYLGRRHDLTLVTFVTSPEEFENQQRLEDYCRQVVMVENSHAPPVGAIQEVLRLPEVLHRYNRPEMWQFLEKIKPENYDVFLIEQLFMSQYHTATSGIKVLQEHNIESDLAKQLTRKRLENLPACDAKTRTFQNAMWLLMQKYEDNTWPLFPLRITVSTEDKAVLDRRCSTGKTVVVENGVDIESISTVDNRGADKILFMGTMNYEPNVDAALYLCNKIMPKVWEKLPTAVLVIAGRNPSDNILNLSSHARVEVMANPEDMDEVAKDCRLAVVPLRSGGGTRIKILHAMALGLPVISTTLGCEGLNVSHGKNILIHDDPLHFASAILRLLEDDEWAYKLRSQGRRLVENQYAWSSKFNILERELLALVNAPGS